MVLKNVGPALVGVALLAGSGAMAAEYRADEFLTLDLSKAVLSPNPLGPPARFGRVPVEAKSDHAAEAAPASAALNPAMATAISISCSWKRGTPSVRSRAGRKSGCRKVIGSVWLRRRM